MINRKKFITQSALTAGTGIIGLEALANAGTTPVNKNIPFVLATWPNMKPTAAAWEAMEKGGTSLDAVEQGGRIAEADPDNNTVGYGGLPDRDGRVTLDACIMDYKGSAGAVTFLEEIMHPVSVARKVMENTPHVTLSGEGAQAFALAQGFKKENLLTDKARKAWEEWKKQGGTYEPIIKIDRHDTMGILAIDGSNNVSGACTTSGLAYKMHGRVGDSPVLGAGLYVDNAVGAACATGVGELVLKTLGSFLIVELMRQGKTPQAACEEAINRIIKKYDCRTLQVCYLAVNKAGDMGAYALQKGFSYTMYAGGVNKVYDAPHAFQ